MIKVCEYCKKTFKADESKRKFCSKKCANDNMRKFNPQRLCKQCNKPFIALRNSSYYCSNDCMNKYIRRSKYNNSYKICEWCHSKYKVFTKSELENRRFCSPSCARFMEK